jgi:hypothetical protein
VAHYSKWLSRKLLFTLLGYLTLVSLPILYKSYEIDDTILMTVLIGVSGLISIYTGVNALQKKWSKDEP